MRTAVLIAVVVLAALVVGAAQANGKSKTVAAVSATDYRAVVVAHRSAGGSAPTATVDVTTYARRGSGWRRLRSTRLHGTFFWNTVASPRAICDLSLVTTGARPHVALRLLVTPSIGCSRALTVSLP